MKVDEQLVDKLAHLARLEFNGSEKQQIIADLDRILGFVAQLQEVNTDGVEPLLMLSDASTSLRADQLNESLSATDALKNAPSHDQQYFKVPTVIKK